MDGDLQSDEFLKNYSKWRVAAAAMGVVLLLCQKKDDGKKDMAKLEGEWSMVSGERDGQALPEDLVKDAKRVAKAGETTVTIGGQQFLKAKFTVDPSKKPKAIDYTVTEGPNKGKTQLGFTSWTGTP